jgi:hypothetical protein
MKRQSSINDSPYQDRERSGLGMHHTLESAIADLVDNSIDAQASRVLIW